MSNPKAIAYDLGVALSSISLWLVPADVVRAIGYATSIVFAGRGYYTGIVLLSKERKDDEIAAMNYDANVDFHERLLESSMELKLQQLENRFTEYLIPLAQRKQQLEQQLARVLPSHPEMSKEDKEEAAREAIENAFEGNHSSSDRHSQIDEESIRKQFPEATDGTYWKAICKALGNGATKEEILKEVLQSSSDTAKAYYELLKQKYLQ